MQSQIQVLNQQTIKGFYKVPGVDKIELTCLERLVISKNNHPVAQKRVQSIVNNVHSQIRINEEIIEIKNLLNESAKLIFLRKQAG